MKTLDIANASIGANLELPEQLKRIKTKTDIKSFEDSRKKEEIWDGIRDAYTSVKGLFSGENFLISEGEYSYLKDVNADIKCKLSIGFSNKKWIFFSLRGVSNRPSKWFFIDNQENIYTEIPAICDLLRKNLEEIDIWEENWNTAAQRE